LSNSPQDIARRYKGKRAKLRPLSWPPREHGPLANGPKPGRAVQIAAAEQGLARMLIAAADDLGVRTQRGQWWLPG
jgi:hypothetical protein